MSKQPQVTHELFASFEEMLSPPALSDILQHKVMRVQCKVSEKISGYSGSEFYEVMADERPLVVKRMRHLSDWISIVTDDARCRSVRLWQYGVLDRIRPHMDHVTLAACHDGEEYALLLEDVSYGLVSGRYPSPTDIYSFLDALAALHALYWEDNELAKPELALCDAEPFLTFSWPVHTDRYEQDVPQITKGWELLFAMLEPDAGDGLQSLMDNLEPLQCKLAIYPSSLLHGDYRQANLAFLNASKRVAALDWQLASYGPVVLDLAWFLDTSVPPAQITAAGDYYRLRLSTQVGEQFDDNEWHPMFEVARLADVLRKANWFAYFAVHGGNVEIRALARRSVEGYNETVRAGLRWL